MIFSNFYILDQIHRPLVAVLSEWWVRFKVLIYHIFRGPPPPPNEGPGSPLCTVCRDQFPKSIKSAQPPLPFDTLVTRMGSISEEKTLSHERPYLKVRITKAAKIGDNPRLLSVLFYFVPQEISQTSWLV